MDVESEYKRADLRLVTSVPLLEDENEASRLGSFFPSTEAMLDVVCLKILGWVYRVVRVQRVISRKS